MGRRKKILTEEEIKAREQKELEKKAGLKKEEGNQKIKCLMLLKYQNPKKMDTNIIYKNIILHLKCNKEDIEIKNNKSKYAEIYVYFNIIQI